ncbi:MAG: SulP family inorganic anion transporter [Bdellovibrionota bacterium]
MESDAKNDSQFALSKIWSNEIVTGFQVSLIALPLCLGISIASGFPPIAGIVTAIIGGLLVSRISGSHITINGPAAGLIVVILAGVEKLGHGDAVLGYKLTLAAIVCAGILQILLGVFKVGKLSTFFPVSAVHGMLAAIGVIILVKQLPVLLGTTAQAHSIFGMIKEIPSMISSANPLILLIGFISLLITIVLPMISIGVVKKIPAPILVVVIAGIMGTAIGLNSDSSYMFNNKEFHLGSKYLVMLPKNVFASLGFPDFSQVLSLEFISVTFSIAIVGSLESLLSAAAIDKLDPYKRKSNLNKDLLAVGVGTTIAGFLGGLPMIAEIVRSSANINNGAKSGWSNFFHGMFLLVAVLLIPGLISSIPLTALAALLIYTGYRLASPQEVLKISKIGLDQLCIFTITLVSVLATDLLIGIAAGILTKIVLHVLRQVNIMHLFSCQVRVMKKNDKSYVVEVISPLVFSNLLSFSRSIAYFPSDATVTIDLTKSHFIDHSAIEFLHDMQRDYGLNGGSLTVKEHMNHEPYTKHVLSARRLKT